MNNNINLITELNIVKGAIASSTSKVTNVLNTIHNFQSQLTSLDNNVIEFTNNVDISLNNIYHEFENLRALVNIDSTLTLSEIINKIDVLEKNFENILNDINNFGRVNDFVLLSNQTTFIKNDVIFNSTLIDNNKLHLQNMQNKFINLINILNKNHNLNIDYNTL
tara:strand:+ start:257 stop:751 length:495 start_codon:yes stop_codon:yes gene_type:complete